MNYQQINARIIAFGKGDTYKIRRFAREDEQILKLIEYGRFHFIPQSHATNTLVVGSHKVFTGQMLLSVSAYFPSLVKLILPINVGLLQQISSRPPLLSPLYELRYW